MSDVGSCPGAGPGPEVQRPDHRRSFFKRALAAGSGALAMAAGSGMPAETASRMPQIRLGPYSVSRLICGSNCFNAGSHLSVFVNHEMRRYYTPEQILKTLRRCEEVGVNCWQSGHGNYDLYRRYVDQGGRMHFLSIEAGDPGVLKTLARGGCIGVAHHGEVTDQLFKAGQLDKVNDFLKRIRDAGFLVGVSTHMPAVVDAIESKGWDLDYYMTCVYERHRSAAELQKLLGHIPIPVGEVYLTSDPPRMYQAMRGTKRPCLAFKILAAGRLCDRKDWVEGAFRETFAGIKPTDAVIVGMYDKFSDQPAENAAWVRKYGAA